MLMKRNQSYINIITPVVLAGGKGKRLRTIVSDIPKVVASVKGRPFITYIFDQLIESGFERVILCAGYLADKMIEILGHEYRNLSIEYSQEPYMLGTGGAVKYALPMIETSHILIMNGDSFIDIDLMEIFTWGLENNFENLIVLSEVSDISRYGAVKTDDNHIVTDFSEKSSTIKPGWINAGVYLFSKALIDQSIKDDTEYSLEYDLIPAIINKIPIGAYLCNSDIMDIGTPESYRTANKTSDK